MHKYILLLFWIVLSHDLRAQKQPLVLPLWENGAPGFEHKKDEPEKAKDWWVKNIHNPSITVFTPDNPNGSAVLIFPGGGHKSLVFNSEGKRVAEFLKKYGITAAVLKYRLFREVNSPYTMDHAEQDAIRAMRVLRSKANEWQIDKDRIGIMAFSAGGELANLIAYSNLPGKQGTDNVESESAVPNFQIQIYPGPLAIPESVSKSAPPAFLLASNNDECCSESIFKLLTAYRKAGAPVEAHFYAKGDHGFNMGSRSELKTISSWPELLINWFTDYHYFKK